MPKLVPLKQIRAGELGVVAEVNGDRGHAQRLHDLGLSLGTTVEMLRQGNPCILRISGTRLCFRENESASVKVFVPATI